MICILIVGALVVALEAATVPCGVPVVAPIENKIVGGIVAKPGSWPWMVMLVDDLGYISGSGFILNKRVILTSAQHFEGYGYSLHDFDLDYWRLYAGEHDITLTDPHEMYYRIKRVVIHPGYNITTLQHDIALVLTTAPMEYNNHTRPVCLPGSRSPPVGQTCYLPGWGGTRNTGNEEVLNQVDLPVLDDSVCQEHFPGYLPETEMCAGHENVGKDWCWDDIGSPLMCKDEESGAWIAHGIASSGGNCTLADEPSVFEDVSMYHEWILTTMENAGYPYEY